jgi:hypothetical protein
MSDILELRRTLHAPAPKRERERERERERGRAAAGKQERGTLQDSVQGPWERDPHVTHGIVNNEFPLKSLVILV